MDKDKLEMFEVHIYLKSQQTHISYVHHVERMPDDEDDDLVQRVHYNLTDEYAAGGIAFGKYTILGNKILGFIPADNIAYWDIQPYVPEMPVDGT